MSVAGFVFARCAARTCKPRTATTLESRQVWPWLGCHASALGDWTPASDLGSIDNMPRSICGTDISCAKKITHEADIEELWSCTSTTAALSRSHTRPREIASSLLQVTYQEILWRSCTCTLDTAYDLAHQYQQSCSLCSRLILVPVRAAV
jgi:hypothetical protein